MTKRRTRAVFWDIDGTLLVTGRAGMIAWERAFAAELPGRPFPSVRPDGLTDHQIAAWLAADAQTGQSQAADAQIMQHAAARLVARYEAELAAALPLRQGRVLDNVRAVLDWLRAADPAPRSWLVTGNTRAGATAKLRHYGLLDYFEPRPPSAEAPSPLGSFSARVEPRAHIVRAALERAQTLMPGVEASEVLVIGDTPHDIEGAHALGVPVLALATNVHSLDELAALQPWRVLTVLPEPAAFAALLDEGAGAAMR